MQRFTMTHSIQQTVRRALSLSFRRPLGPGLSLGAAPLVALAALVASTGCTSQTQTFEGYSDDQVWSAMVAASRAPEYDDWKISDNDVFVDEAGRRIEVYRRLRRLYVSPYSDPRKEDEEWRLQVLLGHDESADAPQVEFTARQITVPAHVWREADRFFAQVRALLGPVVEPTGDEPSTDDSGGTSGGVVDDGETLADDEVPTPPPLPGLD